MMILPDIQQLYERWSLASSEVAACLLHPHKWRDAMQTMYTEKLATTMLSKEFVDVADYVALALVNKADALNLNDMTPSVAATAYNLREQYMAEMMHNLKRNCGIVKAIWQRIVVIEGMAESILTLKSDAGENAFGKAVHQVTFAIHAARDGATQHHRKDMGGAREELARSDIEMPAFRTGYARFDQQGGLSGPVFIAAKPKGRKTTIVRQMVLSGILDWIETEKDHALLAALKPDDLMNARLTDITQHVLTNRSADASDQKRVAMNIGQARKLHASGQAFQPRGVVYFSLENRWARTVREILAMLMMHYIVKEPNAIYVRGQSDPQAYYGANKFPEPRKHIGYYFTTDYRAEDFGGAIASNVSHERIAEFQAGRNQQPWGIRRLALELAENDLYKRVGKRLRVYDQSEMYGGVEHWDDVVSTLIMDRHEYPEFPVGLIGLDYVQSLLVGSGDAEDYRVALTVSRKLPGLLNQYGASAVIAAQRNDASINHEVGDTLPSTPGIRGGTGFWAAATAIILAYGPDGLPDNSGIIHSDPCSIRWRLHSARDMPGTPRMERSFIHPATGYHLPAVPDSVAQQIREIEAQSRVSF